MFFVVNVFVFSCKRDAFIGSLGIPKDIIWMLKILRSLISNCRKNVYFRERLMVQKTFKTKNDSLLPVLYDGVIRIGG